MTKKTGRPSGQPAGSMSSLLIDCDFKAVLQDPDGLIFPQDWILYRFLQILNVKTVYSNDGF
jgi:hypothetical protein